MRFILSAATLSTFLSVTGVVSAFAPPTTKFSSLASTAAAATTTAATTSVLNAEGTKPRTLYDKIWDDHLVDDDGLSTLLYVDRHLVHEVTSPQAFEGLRLGNRGVRRPDCTLTTVDHNVPTEDRSQLIDVQTFIAETASRTQVLQLEQNVKDFGLTYFGMADERQGIVHIIGPEQGFTLPGCVTVCGDSHTATHGAFGAVAFGIGTSEVEHVLATQVGYSSIHPEGTSLWYGDVTVTPHLSLCCAHVCIPFTEMTTPASHICMCVWYLQFLSHRL